MAAALLCGLLLTPVAAAQLAPRATGESVMADLETARQELAARAASLPRSSLATTAGRMDSLIVALRKSLGKDAAKPIDLLDADAKADAYRARAVLLRTQAYLDAGKACLDSDAEAMAGALSSTVELALAGSGSSKQPPVINGVETEDHRPLFVLRDSRRGAVFALDGANLLDAQCEDPVVTATDGQGQRHSVQPIVTGVSPGRIELKLPDDSVLSPGSYVLRVASKRKVLLMGCVAQPEAVAAVQVAPVAKASVDYSLVATCRTPAGEQALPAVSGKMPDPGAGGTASQGIVIDGCDNPVSYAITARVAFGDEPAVPVGPFSQIATAGITAGLPGGLTLSWDPMVRQLFVRPAVSTCKGVY